MSSSTAASQNPPSKHNQPIADPVAHFQSVDWCRALMTDKSVSPSTIAPPDRTPLASTESSFIRETLNTPSTCHACVTFFHMKKSPLPPAEKKQNGEDKKNPFVEMVALLDLGKGVNGYAGTAHGGFYGVVLDEVMGTVANMQAAQGAFTASLTVNFRRPLKTPSIVAVRGQVVRKEGKKLHLVGSFEDRDGKVLADATGLWIMVDRDIGRWTTEEQQQQRKEYEQKSKL